MESVNFGAEILTDEAGDADLNGDESVPRPPSGVDRALPPPPNIFT